MHSEEFTAVALSRIPGIGPKLFRRLIDSFGSAAAALEAGPQELRAVGGISASVVALFRRNDHYREADRIFRFTEANGVAILRAGSPGYPVSLSGFDAAPPILYHLGATDFANRKIIAVVGTRRMSEEGARQVERMIDPLTEFDPLIVSGLAYGVDGAAHRRALAGGLGTLAVMGSGLEYIYPYGHRLLARQISMGRGGLLTEYPHWVTPEREHFPARNRIVAMIADLTLVVESGPSGGSMITANMALECGRRVGACPGRGGARATAGCNALIKQGKAHLIDRAEDIVDLLDWDQKGLKQQQLQLFDQLSGEERRIAQFVGHSGSPSASDLIAKLKISPTTVAGLLLTMEMKGIIRAMPGHRYRLSARMD